MSDIFRSIAAVMMLCSWCPAQNNNQGQNNQFPGGILINADGVIGSPQAKTGQPGAGTKAIEGVGWSGVAG